MLILLIILYTSPIKKKIYGGEEEESESENIPVLDNIDCTMEQIKKHYNISLKKIPSVGDSSRDLEAYKKSGAQPILVRTGNGKMVEKNKDFPKNTLIFDNLMEAAKFIVKSE